MGLLSFILIFRFPYRLTYLTGIFDLELQSLIAKRLYTDQLLLRSMAHCGPKISVTMQKMFMFFLSVWQKRCGNREFIIPQLSSTPLYIDNCTSVWYLNKFLTILPASHRLFLVQLCQKTSSYTNTTFFHKDIQMEITPFYIYFIPVYLKRCDKILNFFDAKIQRILNR